jgi:hypothetical protein
LETQAAEEAKKIEILKKEKEKEAALAEFRRLHEARTGGGSVKAQRMDWMFGGGPSASHEGNASSNAGGDMHEAYLLGKRKATDLIEGKEDTFAAERPLTFSSNSNLMSTSSLPGAVPAMTAATSLQDMAAKFREDPLFIIKKKEQQEAQDIIHAKLLAKRTPSRHHVAPKNNISHAGSGSSSKRGGALMRPVAAATRSSNKPYKFSEEERQKKLEEMSVAAEEHRKERRIKVREGVLEEQEEEAQFRKDYVEKDVAKNFIAEVKQKVFSLDAAAASAHSLAVGLQARRAYLEKDKD